MSFFVDSVQEDAEIELKGVNASLTILDRMHPKTLLKQLTTTFSGEATPRPRELPTPNLRRAWTIFEKIGRLMERVEALEAENKSLKRKNTEFEDKQAKMVKLLTDE
ncbi:hypothetical protein ACKAV7_009951 [Fusarium commune]